MPTLVNVYIQERITGKGIKFMSASLNVSAFDKEADYYNLKVVQGFGELPKEKGYYTVKVEDNDIWLDKQEGVEKTIRVRNAEFTKQDYTIYETPYNQLNLIPQAEKREVKIVRLPNL